MNVQLALDRLTKEECLSILKETASSIDWIEIGTGVIKQYGVSIVSEIKQRYPEKVVVADMKTCDAGRHEAIQAFESGADVTTVMAFSANKTILEMLEAAMESGKRVMVDLLGVTDRNRLVELHGLGVDLVCLHYGKDMQLEKEMNEDIFSLVQGLEGLDIAIAGGINKGTLPGLLEKQLDTVIVGSAITKAEEPGRAAAELKEVVKQYEINH